MSPAGIFNHARRRGRVSPRPRTNDYSVRTCHGFQDVVLKGFVDRGVILCGGVDHRSVH